MKFNNEIEKALVTGEMELPKEEDIKRLNYIFDEKKRKPKDIVSSINEFYCDFVYPIS